MEELAMPILAAATQSRTHSSRKRPRSGVKPTVQHVCKGALLVSLLRCGAASHAGGGQGGNHGPSGPPQRNIQPGDGREWVDWRNQPRPGSNPYGMPFGSPIDTYVERPDSMDGVRALAVELEEEDRHEIGGYVAMVLQKLANMNELFLGERARKDTVFHSASMPSVAVAEFVERVADNIGCPNVCLMLTLVYMDRLALPSSELHLYVTPLTAHRLFAASLIIAIKFIAEKPPSVFDDRFYEKLHSLTGLAVAELKHLEHHMLQALAKDAYVAAPELSRYMVNFMPKHDELVPYVDRPYQGPPPFPFQ